MSVYFMATLGAGAILLLASAWFQIQSVRWGYKAQAIRREIDDLEKEEQTLDHRLAHSLSLSRLDELAKTEFRLTVPNPAQIVFLPDPAR
jgi:hypothetical protein